MEVWTKGLDGGLGRKLSENSLGSDDGMAGDSESLLYIREPCLEAPLGERWCRSHLRGEDLEAVILDNFDHEMWMRCFLSQ